MTLIANALKHFIRTEDGVTSVEYGVLAVLLVLAISVAVASFSGDLTTAFGTIGGYLTKTS